MSNTTAIAAAKWPEWIEILLRYKTYVLLFVAAAVATFIATRLYIALARRLNWVDHPYGRKRHERATPTMGGLVIVLIVFAGAAVALALDNRVGEMLRADQQHIYVLMFCTLCMVGLGIIDDRHRVRAKIKLLVQTVVAVAAVSLGYRIHAFTLPHLGSIPLGTVELGIVGAVMSIVWIVVITNAINLADGLDGLAAGICFFAAAVNAALALWLGNYYMAVMMILLAGSLLGFLPWNFHPARVFLGDTGSLALGMYLALCSLHSSQKSHTMVLILIPLFALGYPIFDTMLAVARRTIRGQPLFASDRDHIHHRLLDRGGSASKVAILIYFVSLLLCIACLAAMTANHMALGLGVAGVSILALFSARVLGYLEWGGWVSRWRGRKETRVLHAAAHLARLKIDQARDPAALLQALAIIASEVGCRAVTLRTGDVEQTWRASHSTGLQGPSDSEPEAGQALQMALDDRAVVLFHRDPGGDLDEERTQLLEELCHQTAVRLAVFPQVTAGAVPDE